MTDPIAVLVRAAEGAADADLEPDPVTAVRARVGRRRTARRIRLGAVAAAVALVAGAAVVAVTAGEAEPEGMATTPDPTVTAPPSTTAEPEAGPYGDVPRSPLSARRAPAVAAVGDDVVVFGGTTPESELLEDGAVYDRETGAWRPMARSPLAGRLAEAGPALAAPVDGGVVVTMGPAVARWDQASDTWTELDDAPALVTDLVAVGDDRVASASGWTVLDASTGTWDRFDVPPPGDVTRILASAWTGADLVVLGVPGSARPDGPAPVTALALDPVALTWRRLAPPPAGAIGDVALAAAWDGERVVVTDPDMRAAAYDPVADTWEPRPDVPARFQEHVPSMTSVGGVSVVTTARTLGVLDARRETWTPFPSPTPSLGGTGPYRLVPVEDTTVAQWVDAAGPDDPDLLLFDPTTLAGDDRRRQVGTASVVMGGDEHVLGTSVDDQVVRVTTATGSGELCQVTSGLGLPLGSDEQRAVREQVPIEDPASARPYLIWFHDEAGGRWEAEVEDTDLLVVDCRDPGVARRLVESVSLT